MLDGSVRVDLLLMICSGIIVMIIISWSFLWF